MSVDQNSLGKKVVARYACSTWACPPGPHGTGEIVGYVDAPRVCIKQTDGTTFWWRADLTDEIAESEIKQEPDDDRDGGGPQASKISFGPGQ